MAEKLTRSPEEINPNDPLVKAEKLAKTKPEVREFLDLYREIRLSKDSDFPEGDVWIMLDSYDNFSYQIFKWNNLSIVIDTHQKNDNLSWKLLKEGTKSMSTLFAPFFWGKQYPLDVYKDWKIKIMLLNDGSIQVNATLKEFWKTVNQTSIIDGDSAKSFISNASSLFLKRKEQLLKESNKKVSEDIKNATKFSQNDITQDELEDLEQKALSA